MDDQANIIKTRYAKTVINSTASLTYEQAYNKIIDDYDNSELKKSIVNLNRFAKLLKEKRV